MGDCRKRHRRWSAEPEPSFTVSSAVAATINYRKERVVRNWQIGDLAVCVLPVGELQLGCSYRVTSIHRGIQMRDNILAIGFELEGQVPPFGRDGFDARRFIRSSVTHARTAA